MRWLLPLLFAGSVLAAESPREIDPNTKTEGGADTRGSGANAGVGTQPENRTDAEKPPLSPAAADKKDKPISARKPQEREREDASQGTTTERPFTPSP